MTTAEEALAAPASPARRLVSLATALLCVALPALRPLVWDGDAASPANLAVLVLLLAASGLGVVEALAGWRRTWRLGAGGALFALLLAWLALAAWRAPDAGTGAALWVQLAVHAAWALWLVQVAPGRERLLIAGLAAGLGAEAVLALLQRLWVLPAIAQANQAGAMAVAVEGVSAGDFADRVAYGGLFGTFTLSNTLAAFLICVLPPLAAAAWRSRGAARAAGLLAAVLAAWALAGTASKGAWIALAAAGGIAWLWWLRGWWRWLPIPAGLLAVAGLAALPGARTGLAASAEVRLGYWQGAWSLIGERPLTGHGIGAFAERSGAVMPLWAEPTRLVHNEVLEAWVSGGLPAALLLAALLAVLALGRVRAPAPLAAPAAPAAGAGAVAGLLTAYLGLLGAYDGQFGWYPGGGALAGMLAWSAALGALVGVLAALALRLRPPAPRWWRLGLAALALHCLIDFDLHAAALWGVMAVCAALVAPSGRERRLAPWGAGLAALAWLALVLLTLVWAARANLERGAEDTLKLLRVAAGSEAKPRQEALAALAVGYGEPPPADEAQARALWQRVWGELEAGADARRRLQLLCLLPPSPQRLAALDGLAPLLPGSPALHEQRAADLVRARRWDDALAAQEQAVALAPANLAVRRRLIALCERAAEALPLSASRWRERGAREGAEVARLEPLVHPRNR